MYKYFFLIFITYCTASIIAIDMVHLPVSFLFVKAHNVSEIEISSEKGLLEKKNCVWKLQKNVFSLEVRNHKTFLDGKPLAVQDMHIHSNGIIQCNNLFFKKSVYIKRHEETFLLTGVRCSAPAFLNKDKKYIEKEKMKKRRSIRVLLASVAFEQNQKTVEWILEAKNAFIGKKNVRTSYNKMSIIIKNKAILVNGTLLKSNVLYIGTGEDGFVQFGGKHYKGVFGLVVHEDKVFLINNVDLEEYVYAVVRSESWPGWPLEVNKVFAIASRSYAMHSIRVAEQQKKIYHVKDSNVHQRYNLYGEHYHPIVRQAVKETTGMCLTYSGRPVLAMFDSCCGGIIPASIENFNFTNDPYLARKYACTFCKKTSLYSWQIQYDFCAFEKLLAQMKIQILPLKRIQVYSKDKAGVVKEVILHGYKQSIKLPVKIFTGAVKGIKSAYFSITNSARSFTVKGRGLGHLTGLCQWGAWQMVVNGWSCESILYYYYPGTLLRCLT